MRLLSSFLEQVRPAVSGTRHRQQSKRLWVFAISRLIPFASFLSRLSLAKLAELERPRRHPKAFGIPSNLFRDQQRDEIASLQLIELHLIPPAKPDCRISNRQRSVRRYWDDFGTIGGAEGLLHVNGDQSARTITAGKCLIGPSLTIPGIGAIAPRKPATARINSTTLSLRARCCALPTITSFLPRGLKRAP